MRSGSVNWTLCLGVPEGVVPGVPGVEGVRGQVEGLLVPRKEFLSGDARGEVCRDVKGEQSEDEDLCSNLFLLTIDKLE